MATALEEDRDDSDVGRIRLRMSLAPEVYSLLEDLAARSHGDKAEVFRKAIGLYKVALDAHDQGLRICAVAGDQEIETEFVGFDS